MNPFAPNISPVVLPWLVTIFCGFIAWWMLGFETGHDSPQAGAWIGGAKWLHLWLGGLVLLVLLRSPEWNGQTLLTVSGVATIVIAIAIGSQITRSEKLQSVLVSAWLVAALLNSVIALCQVFEWTHFFSTWMNGASPGEAYGNLRQRNQLATLTNIGVAALVWGVWRHDASSAATPAVSRGIGTDKVISWVLLTVLVAACAASQSRTGMVGLLLLTFLAFVWRRQLSRQGLLLGMSAPLIYLLMSWCIPILAFTVTGNHWTTFEYRLTGGGALTCETRWVLYNNMADLIAAKPWQGWGWQELVFAHYVGDTDTRFCRLLDNAHNLPIHLAVELGLPVAIVLVLIPLAYVVKAKPLQERQPQRQMVWVVLVLISVHSMLEYPLWYGPFTLCFGLCLGMIWPGGSVWGKSGAGLAIARSVVLVAVLAALSWSLLGYFRLVQLYRGDTRDWTEPMKAGHWEFQSEWPYRYQIEFYKYLTAPLTPENAKERYLLGERLMHYSPEPRVISQHLNAAYMAGLDKATLDELMTRFKRAYPKDYAYFVTGKAPD